MTSSNSSKVILVTGASSGIGKATAVRRQALIHDDTLMVKLDVFVHQVFAVTATPHKQCAVLSDSGRVEPSGGNGHALASTDVALPNDSQRRLVWATVAPRED